MSNARLIAMDMLKYSRANISGNKVGACVVAQNEAGGTTTFGGCNIELATSKVYHAEEVALSKAISEGYPYILECWITSLSEQQRAAMCGYCLQHYAYANPDCRIVVLNP